MAKCYSILFLLIIIYFNDNNNVVFCEKILCVFPINAKSHYLAFEPLSLELANKGHELVVISNFPQNPPVKNILDIDISNYTNNLVGGVDVSELHDIPTGTLIELKMMDLMLENIVKIFESPEVNNTIKSNSIKFDLIICEIFESYFLTSLSYKFKAPIIGFTFSAMMPWVSSGLANPDNPSYIPTFTSQHYYKMNFLQRLTNSLQTFISKIVYNFHINRKAISLAKNYIEHNMPPLEELTANMSVLFFNSHFSFHGVRPLLPGVIEVGGLHIGPQKKIPKDLEKFINESTHGVIYFCTGSMLKASTLPEDKRLDLIEVFSKLSQRVLWKWETETMPDKPDNVKLVKWMPQRDVLAHPNVKLFISHGGLLGTTEAVYSGVPIIGIPFYGDQGLNIEAVQAAGAGIRLDFYDLNKETLDKAIREILDNPNYKQNADQLSERFRDRPQSPLETAVYWTEYVIRHKGAPHLRSAAVDLTWYQYLLLDVIAFILVSLITVLAILYYTTKSIYNFIKHLLFKTQKAKSKSKRKNE